MTRMLAKKEPKVSHHQATKSHQLRTTIFFFKKRRKMKPLPLARKSNCFAGSVRDPGARLRAREMRTRRSMNHSARSLCTATPSPGQVHSILGSGFQSVSSDCCGWTLPELQRAKPHRHSAPHSDATRAEPGPRGTFCKAISSVCRSHDPPAPHVSPDA